MKADCKSFPHVLSTQKNYYNRTYNNALLINRVNPKEICEKRSFFTKMARVLLSLDAGCSALRNYVYSFETMVNSSDAQDYWPAIIVIYRDLKYILYNLDNMFV